PSAAKAAHDDFRESRACTDQPRDRWSAVRREIAARMFTPARVRFARSDPLRCVIVGTMLICAPTIVKRRRQFTHPAPRLQANLGAPSLHLRIVRLTSSSHQLIAGSQSPPLRAVEANQRR